MSRRLTMLQSRVQTTASPRVATLEPKAGTTPRIRGRAWQATRARIATTQQFSCQSCGRTWLPWRDQVDHRVPLEQGGSNDDANLQLLCDDCHTVKTTAEARARASGIQPV